MADEELQGEEGGKKKSKLMLIIIIAVVVLAGGGGAAYFFLFMGDDAAVAEEVVEETEQGATRPPPDGEAIYVAMPRPFQFNAPGITRERIVQIEVQLMVRGIEKEELAQRHIPMIEGNLLQVFSTSNADELVTAAGKQELRDKSTQQIRRVMNDLEKTPVVDQVLFTGFVIQ